MKMTSLSLKSKKTEILESKNPARNFESLGSVHITLQKDISGIVQKARTAQPAWQKIGLEGRISTLQKLFDVLKLHRNEFVQRTSIEMGMPVGLSENIVDGGLEKMAWDLKNAPDILKPVTLFDDGTEINEQIFEPFGVMACIVAWNFPFGNFTTSVVPALIAGNTVVMKYSEEVPMFSKYLENIIHESNILPEGVINFIYGDGITGSYLCEEEVDLISFTGSSETGKKIYAAAAQKLMPACLELGGSSPGIVFEDCSITDNLIESIFWKRFLNSGQFCDGLKRLIVHHTLFDECVKKLSLFAATIRIGDPLDPTTQLGPLVAERQVQKLESQIQDSVKMGAKIICGGKRPSILQGAYFEPTILTGITHDMPVWREEIFGPALPIISFQNYDDAISLAHDTEYGLSAVVYSEDRDQLKQAQDDLKVGSVDDGFAHYFRPQNPFGGYKKSGIGRQGGVLGFHDVCQIKVKAYRK